MAIADKVCTMGYIIINILAMNYSFVSIFESHSGITNEVLTNHCLQYIQITSNIDQ